MQASTSTTETSPHAIQLSPRDIPALPDAMVELLGIANDPAVSFTKLSSVIGRDQALTLRMLAVANSPYYGCSRRIDSVRGAIAVLGTRQVQNIASAMALAPAFDSDHGPRLWQHGLGYAPQVERACLDQAEAENRPLEEIESEHLGTDHAHLGARACASWKLPERLTEFVALHHEHHDSDGLDLKVLHAANALARICEATEPGPTSAGWDATLEALTRLDFSEDELLRLLEYRGDVLAEADAFG